MKLESLLMSMVVFIGVALLMAATPGAAVGDEAAESGEIAAALEAARDAETPRFHLIVHRTDRSGQRSLEVFPSGVGIWNGRAQISLPPEARASLLEILRGRGFAAMAPSFGGKVPPSLEQAALRVTCRVALEIGGLEKTSVQLADGEQSAELAALADDLLDRAEPLAAEGVTAESLDDALAKVASGVLAAEVLRLRLMWLPAAGDGEILTMRNGRESRRLYDPGRRIGEAKETELSGERVATVAKALLDCDVSTLPVNLWSGDHVELEVGALGHRTTVIAREFSRLAGDPPGEARARFSRLVAALRGDG
jgi:hypothetical protein